MSQGSLFCFGYGYSADALAKTLDKKKWNIHGTKRETLVSKDNNPNIISFNGYKPIPNAKNILMDMSHLLISIPPSPEGDPVIALHRSDIANATNLKWIGYLSTTGVYGNSGGAIVDEKYLCKPTNARSKRRLKAEKDWLKLFYDFGLPIHIFRLAGIYGPGRSAIDSVLNGRAKRISVPGHKFSRIHVCDIARVLAASIKKPNPGRIYNVCDNESASGADVTLYACELLGVSPPPLINLKDAQLSTMARSFYSDNRRVDNQRIKKELSFDFKYPTYREGLKSIYKALV